MTHSVLTEGLQEILPVFQRNVLVIQGYLHSNPHHDMAWENAERPCGSIAQNDNPQDSAAIKDNILKKAKRWTPKQKKY